ncbi:MAG: xseA [Rhizobium sp.]|nr:xseA [Rhizobium sp.]
MALIEERKRKLQSEGLFDAARKQLLPFVPMVIGVVTSPTGAVIRDILHRISDRFPLHVIVWPVKVQGEGSGAEVANAIRGFNEFQPGGPIARPDVLIVARGGGSLEDLWGFNDEIVVRAAAGSEIPLISAVGHETDWTLIDYAADQRAPTPTGAAEMAVPVKADLEAQIANLAARLSRAMSRQMDTRRREVRDLIRALPSLDQILALPRRRFDEAASRLGRGLEMTTVNKRRAFERVSANLRPAILSTRITEQRQKLGERMTRAERVIERMFERMRRPIARADAVFEGFPTRLLAQSGRQKDRLGNAAKRGDSAVANLLARHRQTLSAQQRILESLSYKNVLKRGYAVIRGDDERVLSSAASISEGDALSIEFADGTVKATAGEGSGATASPAKKRPSPGKPPSEKPNQGSLF